MTRGFLPDDHDVNAFMVRVRGRDLLGFERGTAASSAEGNNTPVSARSASGSRDAKRVSSTGVVRRSRSILNRRHGARWKTRRTSKVAEDDVTVLE
jgi:hypothetical protein